MYFAVRLKFWFFDNYWWMVCISLFITIVAALLLQEYVATSATAIGAILSLVYFIQKQKLEELRLFRELFKEFNERYEAMNEDLERIAATSPADLSNADRSRIIEYLNLCGEEYLFFKRGYIEPSVWLAWLNGMKVLFSSPAIRTIWNGEKGTRSYYDLPL
jgi:hypothetical protein